MGPFSRIRAHQSTRSSVRSAGVGGRAATPRIEKFRANSVYRTSSSCSKILKDKKYFNTVKIFRANYVFQGKRRLFKTLNDKKYILNTANSCTLCFQGKHKLLKNPECKNYIQYSENFRANSVFQGKRKLFKILNDKKSVFHTVNSGHTLFFRASKSCSNTLDVKSILNTV